MELLTVFDGMRLGSGHGNYYVLGSVNGEQFKLHTTNSIAFDWWDDDSDPEMYKEALDFCNTMLTIAYIKKHGL